MRAPVRTRLAVLALAAAALGAPAAHANGFLQTLEQQIRELDRALFSPPRLERFEPIDATRTCADLSREVTALVPRSRSYRPGFYDDPTNAAIVAAGTVFTPAFYMLAIPEYARYREKRHIVNARARIEDLRAAMADRLCFAR